MELRCDLGGRGRRGALVRAGEVETPRMSTMPRTTKHRHNAMRRNRTTNVSKSFGSVSVRWSRSKW